MAWTQADLDALDAAIAAGGAVEAMTFGDQSITFRSLADMLRLRAVMAQALNASNRGSRLAATSKGV